MNTAEQRPRVSSLTKGLQELLGSTIRSQSQLQSQLAEVTVRIVDALERLPLEIRPVVRALAGRGWFLSCEMGIPDIHQFRSLVAPIQGAAIDELMGQWVTENAHRIQASAVARFPARRSVLNAAFTAHSSSMCELSVPVLLAQAEGMCVEILGKLLYAAKSGVPRTKEAAQALVESELSEVLLLPLMEPHGLGANEIERKNWPEAPNRHEILHGIDCNYGTALNSLKSISLIDYLVTVVADRPKGAGTNGLQLVQSNAPQ